MLDGILSHPHGSVMSRRFLPEISLVGHGGRRVCIGVERRLIIMFKKLT